MAKGLSPYLVFKKLVLLEDKQEVSIRELINLYLDPLLALRDLLFHCFHFDLEVKGSSWPHLV